MSRMVKKTVGTAVRRAGLFRFKCGGLADQLQWGVQKQSSEGEPERRPGRAVGARRRR